ncbi:MAG: 23S rRNA (pseudouridine(1915)-N(3))-methyltransferase RlmH [Alphaproteobacteria bacterium]
MRLVIAAVGRARSAPEARLAGEYLDRLNGMARPLGLGPATLIEVEDRKAPGPQRAEREAALLRGAAPEGARLVALDERGKALTSGQLARQLADWRDSGVPATAFLIGGADGLTPELRQEADFILSFGPATWPHLLVRTMLSEQLYRAATILAGHPYHRQ